MSIHPEILSWSTKRPLWQQDALRRLAGQNNLSNEDIDEIVDLCKLEYGAAAASHIFPHAIEGSGATLPVGAVPPVQLIEISAVENINALKSEQSLGLAAVGVTVVFGENAAGKSGYVRILKQLCRARGSHERLIPNIYSEDAPPSTATLRYSVGGDQREVVWKERCPKPKELEEISIFDSKSAAVYVTQENDIAYLPHGMDLFPKLGTLIDVVRGRLEAESASLKRMREKWESIRADSRVFAVLENLHVKEAKVRAESLAEMSTDDESRLGDLRVLDKKYKSVNPTAQAKLFRLSADRISKLAGRVKECETGIDTASVTRFKEECSELRAALSAAQAVKATAFGAGSREGLGEESWRRVWEAARKFATTDGKAVFPQREGDACLLCQQTLSSEAADLMSRFERFVNDEIQQTLLQAIEKTGASKSTFEKLLPESLADATLAQEIASLDPALAQAFGESVSAMSARVKWLSVADAESDWSGVIALTPSTVPRLLELSKKLGEEAAVFESAEKPGERESVAAELRELEDRVTLKTLLPRVYEQIQREKELSCLHEAISSASTAPVTRRNTELLGTTVTEPLSVEFNNELQSLRLTHVPISLEARRGEKTKALHSLSLAKKSLTRVSTEEILSEGEHRCIALAAFLAEVSLQSSSSTLVFDDPVSSLDHGRRKYVAKRIVEIAKGRPVVVFTHDLVFLWMIQNAADADAIPLTPRFFRRDGTGAGLITNEWPWDGAKVKTRIGSLRTDLVRLKKMAVDHPKDYEVHVRVFYGHLRDTWERAVEEVLFQGAIRRFGSEVRTQSLKKLHKVTEENLKDLEKGMTKTSAWVIGHDHPPEQNEPVPDPAEAENDLASLEKWVGEINAIHNK